MVPIKGSEVIGETFIFVPREGLSKEWTNWGRAFKVVQRVKNIEEEVSSDDFDYWYSIGGWCKSALGHIGDPCVFCEWSKE